MRLLLLAACLSTSGCGWWIAVVHGGSQTLVSAAPLRVSDPKSSDFSQLTTIANQSDAAKRDYLGVIVLDSQTKCVTFLNSLVVAQNTVNTTGDILSTLLTGAGSVFKPISTVHGLAAGSTFVTGTKATIDANIYAKASIVNFQTALQQSYFKKIADYAEALPNLNSPSVGAEVVKIQSIHAMCTLVAAESAISTTITSSPTPAPKPTGLVATAYDGAVQLTWSASAGATSYSVFQAASSGAESASPVQSGITSTTATVKGLTNGTPVFFRVTAQNGAGSSDPSDEVTVTPVQAAGAPPTPATGASTHAPVPGSNLRTN